MNGRDIFLALDFIGEDLVEQAEFDAFPAPRRRMRPLLAAALIAVLLLAGCAVAYTQGWFADFFQASTQEPLTQGQMGYLQEHEQIIAQAQTHGGGTSELRSALNDGTTINTTEMLALNIYKTFYGQASNARGVAQAKAVLFTILVAGIGLLQLVSTRKKEVQQ